MFVFIWVIITYFEFFSQISDKMGLIGYSLFSIFFIFLGTIMWLMSTRKLPAYIIEGDDEDL